MEQRAYTYQSEGGHGQRTFVATCPLHGRDLSIHPNRHKVEKVAEIHHRLFHVDQYGVWP